ncbi:penicillin-binding protein activator LpoB [Chitinophaga solisilvae]|uniref:Penicillin-binding protein activator LpoB n=1 Tax=Chitinophaga solisilvae TaxID=1233460 RepID=A0A433WJR3_9BACT|nr:penicillin-binding protein activator LpoB [Chitinophaga solisilvae]NSL88105.1 penicillin-binding protein activator LpoB [Chitinophaga solisilvae]
MFNVTQGAVISALCGCLFLAACAPRQVTRVSENEQIDVSGRWNNTDSRLVAEAMTTNILSENWLSDFLQQHKGAKPVVIVGLVSNKSHEHIDAETFVKDVERSFVTTQKVKLVQAGSKREELRGERADQQKNASVSTMKKWGLEIGADYILQGSINSIVDSHKKKNVTYYQVDLELTDIQSNEVVWIGNKKIAKYIRN